MAATGATSLLLVDRTGILTRIVRLPKAPPGGWTRQLLNEAVRAQLDQGDQGDLPALSAESYAPTVAITDHVRARNPRCTAYDCPQLGRTAAIWTTTCPGRADPTEVDNLAPRHRRHHELKTRGLVRDPAQSRRVGRTQHAHRTHRHHQARTPTRLRTRRRLRPHGRPTTPPDGGCVTVAAGRWLRDGGCVTVAA